MADDNRYGGYGRDRDRDDRSDYTRGYGSQGYGGYNQRDDDRGRGYGAYGQAGSSYARSGYASGNRDDRQAYDGSGRDDDRYDNRDEERRVATDETDRLIASNKVEGTRVYDRRGNRLGTIYNFMVDKRSGRVEYAVLSFGGFLGMGERHYPLPWNQLTYDERQGGYVVDITERDLERAPSHRAGEQPRFDRGYSSDINRFYGIGY